MLYVVSKQESLTVATQPYNHVYLPPLKVSFSEEMSVYICVYTCKGIS